MKSCGADLSLCLLVVIFACLFLSPDSLLSRAWSDGTPPGPA